MKRLIVLTSIVASLAVVGCASRNANRGGTEDNNFQGSGSDMQHSTPRDIKNNNSSTGPGSSSTLPSSGSSASQSGTSDSQSGQRLTPPSGAGSSDSSS